MLGPKSVLTDAIHTVREESEGRELWRDPGVLWRPWNRAVSASRCDRHENLYVLLSYYNLLGWRTHIPWAFSGIREQVGWKILSEKCLMLYVAGRAWGLGLARGEALGKEGSAGSGPGNAGRAWPPAEDLGQDPISSVIKAGEWPKLVVYLKHASESTRELL